MKPIEQWKTGDPIGMDHVMFVSIVAEIRESYRLGRENQMQLSRRFGVSQPVISHWVRNVVRVP